MDQTVDDPLLGVNNSVHVDQENVDRGEGVDPNEAY